MPGARDDLRGFVGVDVVGPHDGGGGAFAVEVADALVLQREFGGAHAVLVGAGAEHHVVGGLVGDFEAEAQLDVGADAGRE